MQNSVKKEPDLLVFDEQKSLDQLVNARLTFDGYQLKWIQAGANQTYTAFSGVADESARESAPDLGPTPQGKYAINPARIQSMSANGAEHPAWGRFRVPLEPYRATVQRMTDCFGVIRHSMYIHGGNALGTIGCIELNNDQEENNFFTRLQALDGPIELDIKYTGSREAQYEDTRCPI